MATNLKVQTTNRNFHTKSDITYPMPRHEDVWGSGGTTPRILILVARLT